jgi:5-formyltetrahydrofolate cyclo-ligase
MTEDRDHLRRQLRDVRRALPANERIAAAEGLAERLLSLPFLPSQGFVAGYWALDGEIALHAFQLRLPAALSYCLPVLHEDGTLRFAPWRPGAPLRSNRFGIPEPDIAITETLTPVQMALVVTPLVGFDTAGHRLGMGGGWYDRSFAFRQTQAPPPWLIGAAFSVQQTDAVRAETWDVPLDAICTEHHTFLTAPDPA